MMKFIGSALLACSATIAFAQDVEIARFDVLGPEAFAVSQNEQGSRLSFAASGAVWNLDLALNARLAQQLPSSSTTRLYRGSIAGNANSWVRLSERKGLFQGLIFDGVEYHALDSSNTRGDTSNVRFYALKDTLIAPGSLGCGMADGTSRNFSSLQAQAVSVTAEIEKAAAATASQSIDVIVVGDSQFQTENPADPTAALMDRLNVIDGYYSDQVGVTLNVTEFRLTDAATEPFTTNDASDLLDEVANYKNSEAATRNAGLLHLFTGRNLDGSTAGIAFRGALCSSRFGSAVSEGRRNLNVDSLIAAHEFGHNFGAPHDGEDGSVCSATPRTFLMAPSINNSSTFSDCSLQEIQADVAVASCITAIEPIDVLPILNNFPNSVSVTDTFTGRIQVTNNGNADASNIVLDIAVPAAVELDQTSLPAGCSVAGTGAQCDIVSLSGGSNSDFQFNFTAVAPGDAEISATTTTPADDNTANDSGSRIVVINAIVDLSATLSTDSEFVVGETENLTIGIQNNSADDSGAATVQLNASTFLQIESAASGCLIAGTVVTCQSNNVGANSSQDFVISVSGAQSGSTIISATASGAGADPVSANDRQDVSITVAAAASATDLSVSLSGPVSLTVNDSADYTLTIENTTGNSAANSTVVTTLPATLRGDSVDNSDCSVSATELNCDFGMLAGSAQLTVIVSTTAISSGTGTLNASINTTTIDSNSANDSDAASVTVNAAPTVTPPPSTDSGGGGGSSSLVSVLLLGLAAWRRRRTARLAL